jgi:uncharacterized protein YjbJ (UPF0337 family)
VGRKSSSQDKGEGALDKVKGRAKEATGAVTGDKEKKGEGHSDQTKGTAKVRGDVRVVVERIRASPGMILAATMAAILITFVGRLVDTSLRSEEPHLQMVHVSSFQRTPLSTTATYFDIDVAVNNAGTATAKGCYAKAYNHLLFSEEIDETTELGSSEQFDLSAHGGHVAPVSVYLQDLSGEALFGGGLRAPVFFRVECENAESSEEGMTVKVSGPASGSATP